MFGQNARETGVPASVWRYYLLANRPETADSEFTWSDFVVKSNADLLNNLGNLVNRMIKFVNAKYDSVIPDPSVFSAESTTFDDSTPYPFEAEDLPFVADVNTILASFIDQMDHQKIRAAIATLLMLCSRGNQYIQDNKVDNALLASNPQRCAQVALLTLNLIYTLSASLHPIMPSTSTAILNQLDATPRRIPDTFSIDLLPGHRIGTAQHLFSRIDSKNVEVWKTKYGGDATLKDGEKEEGSKKNAKKLAAKRKLATAAAAAAAKENEIVIPEEEKSEELKEAERKVIEQGERVRELKSNGTTKEGVQEGVDKLMELKGLVTGLKKLLVVSPSA